MKMAKVILLMDGDNLNYLRTELGIWQINFNALEKIIEEFILKSWDVKRENLEIAEKRYCVFEEKLSRTENFWEYLKRLNYQIIKKSPMTIYHDVIRYGLKSGTDILVLISGNGQLERAIKYTKGKRGKEIKIITIGSKKSLAEKLKEASDSYILLDDIKEKIKRS